MEKKEGGGVKEQTKEEIQTTIRFNWKEVVFFLVSGGLLIANGYFWKQIIVDQKSVGPVSYVVPIACMAAFAVFFSLSAMLCSKKWIAWVLLAASSFGAIGFVPLWQASFAAAVLVYLSLMYSFHAINSSYTHSTTFHASAAMRAGLSSLFTGLVFVVSFYYLQANILRPPGIIPQELINRAVSLAGGIVDQQIEGQVGKLEEQIQEGIGNQLPQGLSLQALPPELLRMIPQELLRLIPGLGGSQGNISQTPPKGTNKLIDTQGLAKQAAEAIQQRIDAIIGPYKPFIPYVFTAFFFLTAKGLTFFLQWLTLPAGSLVLKFFATVGIVKREKVLIEVERIFF
jgi:hypothetical protein